MKVVKAKFAIIQTRPMIPQTMKPVLFFFVSYSILSPAFELTFAINPLNTYNKGFFKAIHLKKNIIVRIAKIRKATIKM